MSPTNYNFYFKHDGISLLFICEKCVYDFPFTFGHTITDEMKFDYYNEDVYDNSLDNINTIFLMEGITINIYEKIISKIKCRHIVCSYIVDRYCMLVGNIIYEKNYKYIHIPYNRINKFASLLKDQNKKYTSLPHYYENIDGEYKYFKQKAPLATKSYGQLFIGDEYNSGKSFSNMEYVSFRINCDCNPITHCPGCKYFNCYKMLELLKEHNSIKHLSLYGSYNDEELRLIFDILKSKKIKTLILSTSEATMYKIASKELNINIKQIILVDARYQHIITFVYNNSRYNIQKLYICDGFGHAILEGLGNSLCKNHSIPKSHNLI